jgi:hypothetical protein
MRANGVLGDVQTLRDLVGAEMLIEEEKDLQLARGQAAGNRLRHSAVRGPAVANLLEQAAGHETRERCLAGGRSVEEVDEAFGRLGLQQIAGGTAADRREEVLLVAGSSQDDYLTVGGPGPQPRQCLEPAEPGHRQIEQNDVGLKLSGEIDRLQTVAGLSNHVEAVTGKQGR